MATWKPDYVTTEAFAVYLGVPDSRDDVRMGQCIATASRAADDHVSGAIKRQFGNTGSTVVTRTYRRMWYHDELERWVVEIDDVYDATGLVVTADGVDVSAKAILGPDNALADGMVYEYLTLPDYASVVTVQTSKWGWPTIPVPVTEAVLLQAHHLYSRKNAPFGIAPGAAGDTRLLNRVDPGLWLALAGYHRAGAVA